MPIPLARCLLAALLLLAPLVTGASAQERRVALVIGNSAYTGLPRLPNSLNDAADMAQVLDGFGFEVILEKDADRARMEAALRRFSERLTEGGVALVYFSGHGVQVDNKNFLVPVGNNIRFAEDVRDQALGLARVLDALRAKPRDVNLVILDACSDPGLQARDGSRPKGLARPEAPPGTLIAFAADINQLASGGWERNSLYTAELLKELKGPRRRVEDVFQAVRKRILEVSGGDQRPVEFTALTARFDFGGTVRAGQSFRDCPDCPLLVVVPAGRFAMGSANGSAREQPVHEVTIREPFAIGKNELTFAEWDACARAGGCRAIVDDRGWGRGDRPVVGVSWDHAQAYVRWLSLKTGNTYRLPSEAEWEYAARGGTTTAFPWGDTAGTQLANCRDCGSRWSGVSTAPVGSFKPNPLGLNDMNGNVFEWVEDCAQDSYDGAPADGKAVTRTVCRKTVLRGGSFREGARAATSTFRGEAFPGQSRDDFGFRVVRVLQ